MEAGGVVRVDGGWMLADGLRVAVDRLGNAMGVDERPKSANAVWIRSDHDGMSVWIFRSDLYDH